MEERHVMYHRIENIPDEKFRNAVRKFGKKQGRRIIRLVVFSVPWSPEDDEDTGEFKPVIDRNHWDETPLQPFLMGIEDIIGEWPITH